MTRPLIVSLLVALAGCETDPVREIEKLFEPTKAQQTLNAGLKLYEDGKYEQSQKSLQSAIQQGLGESDRVTAHKHLAFIHCASNREPECRAEFKKALAIDPGMDLAPEEAGHPVWGRVFRSVKAGR